MTTRPTVNGEDAARADGVLLAWAEAEGWPAAARRGGPRYPRLRGLLIAAFADCRHDAYADAFADARAAGSDA